MVVYSGEAGALGTGFSIDLTTSGSGSGLVTGSSSIISCTSTGGTASGTCTAIDGYPEGSTAILTATPNSSSSFSSWSGCDSTSDNVCFVSKIAGETANITVSFVPDITAPTVSISGVPAATDGSTAFTARFTFSEDIGSTFNLADVTAGLTNATASSFATLTSGTVFAALITPDGSGDVTVGLAASAVTDSAGNSSLPLTGETATLDTTNPTVIISGVPDPNYGPVPFDVTYTFSEAIVGFNAADVTSTMLNGTITNFTEVTANLVYTFKISPNADKDTIYNIGLPAGSVHDLAGNPNDAPTALYSTAIDNIPPSVTISGVPSTTDGSTAFTVNYVFDKDVGTSFEISDVTNGLSNATASNFVETDQGVEYSVLITPNGGGDVSLVLNAGAVENLGGYAATVGSVTYTALLNTATDTTAPTVSIIANVDSFSGTTPFTATFTFSEGVTGFALADITVGNGAASSLSGSGDTYSATITPADTGNATIDVAADVASDGSGNGNIAATQLIIRSSAVKQTQDRIVQSMQSRANQLVSNQTSLFEFLQGGRGGFFNANGSEATGYFNISSKHKGYFWFDVNGSWSSDNDTRTKYGLGTFGSHAEINENLLLGGMVQIDITENTDASSTVRSKGWLAGPFVIGRHPNQDLYFEGAILYGQTYNRIKPTNTYEDKFKSDRWLFRGALTGEIVTEDVSLFPNIKFSHTTDNQQAYTDSLSNLISEQSISLTEISAGIDFNRPIVVDGGDLALIGGISGIWSGSDGNGGSAGTINPAYDGGRAKVHLGMNFKDESGIGARLTGFYDGIGADNYHAYGASVSIKKRF
ncbi:MAG: Ig-like domain-containing protein [Lentilitoribacter sp.]